MMEMNWKYFHSKVPFLKLTKFAQPQKEGSFLGWEKSGEHHKPTNPESVKRIQEVSKMGNL